MDPIDWKILDLLQRDGRSSVEEIARKVGLTKTPVSLRIRNLEKDGVIVGYSARVDAEVLGYAITAFTSVVVKHLSEKRKSYSAAVLEIAEVLECHLVTGPFDLLLKIRVASMKDYEELIIERLARIDGFERLTTIAIVLSTCKEEAHVAAPSLRVSEGRGKDPKPASRTRSSPRQGPRGRRQ